MAAARVSPLRPSAQTQEQICLALFYTVDWLRELVNAFCSQKESSMRAKVLSRLRQLAWLERQLDTCLVSVPSFRIPGVLSEDAPRLRAAASKKAEKDAAKAEKDAAKASKVAEVKKAKEAKTKKAAKKQKKKAHGSDVESSEGEAVDEGELTEEEDPVEPIDRELLEVEPDVEQKKTSKARPKEVAQSALPQMTQVSTHRLGRWHRSWQRPAGAPPSTVPFFIEVLPSANISFSTDLT